VCDKRRNEILGWKPLVELHARFYLDASFPLRMNRSSSCTRDVVWTRRSPSPQPSPQGEGEPQTGSWSQCAPKMASGLPMNRAWFVVPPLGGRGASDRLKPATSQNGFMVPIRAKNGVGAVHEPPFQRGRQTNLSTPHPGPLPVEGRGRIGSPVHGLNARNLGSGNSLPVKGEGES